MESGGVSVPVYSVPAVEDGDQLGESPFDLDDLPPEIRMKIDEIVRNNEDFEAQIDAIDALLFGRRRPSDQDIESGVDCYDDSDSASNGTNPASVASSSEYATVGAALSQRPTSTNRSTAGSTAGLYSCMDPADSVTHLIVPPPPPELFDTFSPSATGFECVPPPPSDFYPTLPPPVFEVTDDEFSHSAHFSAFSFSKSTQLPFTPPPDYDSEEPPLSFLPPPPDFVAGSASVEKSPPVKPNVVARFSQSAAPNPSPTPLVSVSTHFRSTVPPPVAPKPSLAKVGSVGSSVASPTDFRNGAATLSQNSTTFDVAPIAAAVQQQQQQQQHVTPLPKNVPTAAIAELSSKIAVEPPKMQPQPQPSSSSVLVDDQKAVVSVASPIPVQPVVVIDAIVAPVAGGRSPSTSRRRFTGTTEVESQQQLNVTTRQKTSTGFLQKLMRTWKRSSANADLGAEKSQSELSTSASASALPKQSDWSGGGTLPSKSKKRPVSGPVKFSGVDTSGAVATLPRNSKMSSGVGMLQVIAEKPTKNASEGKLRESSSAASLRGLPRSTSFEPTSNDNSGPKAKKSAARLQQTQSCYVGLPEAEIELNDDDHDDRDSSLGSSGEDEYDSVHATLRRMNKRKHLRDETGRLTIASYDNHAMSKATSMMTLNITKWEDPGPRPSFIHSRTTDDLESHPDAATSKRFDNVPVGGTLQYKKKNPLQQLTATAFSTSGSTTSSMFTGNRSPKLSRPASSALLQGSVQNYCDEVDEIQRSNYLSAPSWSTAANGAAAVTSNSGQSLAEITSWLLRRSLMTSLVDEDSPLMDAISLVSSALNSPMNSETTDLSSGDTRYTTSSNGDCKLSTFQSPLKPMHWSDDSKSQYPVPADADFSFDRLFLPYFTSDDASPKRPKWGVTVQPAASGAKSSSTPAEVVPAASSVGLPKQLPLGRPAKPVPAQRPKSLHTEGVARNQNKLSPSVAEAKNNTSTSSGGPGPGLLPRQTSSSELRPSPLTPVGRTVLATSRGHTPPPDYDDVDDLELQTASAVAAIDHWGVHSQQELTPNLLPPAEFSSDGCDVAAPLDPSAAQEMVELVLFKSYSSNHRPIQEAIDDLRAIVVDIEWTKSSVSTSGYVAGISAGGSDARDALSVAVRKFVTESKNFVACVVDASAKTAINGAVATEFCSKISSSMRALASMTIGCRRLGGWPLSFPVKSVVEVIDYVAEVVRLFGETLDAAQLIESRSEAGRRFAIDDINAHVVSLASILGQLVQRLRAMV